MKTTKTATIFLAIFVVFLLYGFKGVKTLSDVEVFHCFFEVFALFGKNLARR